MSSCTSDCGNHRGLVTLSYNENTMVPCCYMRWIRLFEEESKSK